MIMFSAFPLRHKRHNGPYDYDYDRYVTSGNQALGGKRLRVMGNR